jgi:hypothetical protein
MSNYLVELERRIRALERQVKFANKELVGVVTSNEDPEGRNRIKVSCPDVYGSDGESPWLVSRSMSNGSNSGSIWSPQLGDRVFFTLRDGNPDAGQYFGGPRDVDSPVPDRFLDPKVNGVVTPSGLVDEYNDIDGSRTIETADGKLVITSDGTFHIYGLKVFIHAPIDLDSDKVQYGITSEYDICPFSGKGHTGSSTCKVGV